MLVWIFVAAVVGFGEAPSEISPGMCHEQARFFRSAADIGRELKNNAGLRAALSKMTTDQGASVKIDDVKNDASIKEDDALAAALFARYPDATATFDEVKASLGISVGMHRSYAQSCLTTGN